MVLFRTCWFSRTPTILLIVICYFNYSDTTIVKNYDEKVIELFEKTFELFESDIPFYSNVYPMKSLTSIYTGDTNQKIFNIELNGQVNFIDGMLTEMEFVTPKIENPINHITQNYTFITMRIMLNFVNVKFSYLVDCDFIGFKGQSILYISVPLIQQVVDVIKNLDNGQFQSKFADYVSISGNILKSVEIQGYPYLPHIQVLAKSIKYPPYNVINTMISSILDWPFKKYLDVAGQKWSIELCVLKNC